MLQPVKVEEEAARWTASDDEEPSDHPAAAPIGEEADSMQTALMVLLGTSLLRFLVLTSSGLLVQ